MNASRQAAFIAPASPRQSANGEATLRWALLVSVGLHLLGIAGFVVWKGLAPPTRPPQYRVELVGAPGLKKQMGIVSEQQPTAAAPKPAEAPKAAERPPEPVKTPPIVKAKPKPPEPKPVKATPNQTKAKPAAADAPKTATKAAPPVAGSGQTKGRGTDITNMVVEGIQFPYPVYLDNIVRQIILAFDWTKGGSWVAEVRFVIQRDGSVKSEDITILTSSGNREFDREGRGAIESVGNSRKFNALPSGFSDDVLPVYFTFRPPPN
ncbi:MAG: TonB C-terminal domain-containing protein [Gemmatimonadaceae bacterium]